MNSEIIIAVANFVLFVSLVPSIVQRKPPARSTCILQVLVASTFVTAYFLNGWMLASTSNMFNLSGWIALLVLAIKRPPN